MASWFDLINGKDKQFRFVLKAANGEAILTSEQYQTRASAENGIASVRANCGTDSRYDLQSSANGKFYFNLRAANQQVIGTSEMYESEKGRERGIASVKACGTTESVREAA